jgi:hypothetical protein
MDLQNLIGARKKQLAEVYFSMATGGDPRLQKMLEQKISAMYGMKSEARFRSALLVMLLEAFINGTMYKGGLPALLKRHAKR